MAVFLLIFKACTLLLVCVSLNFARSLWTQAGHLLMPLVELPTPSMPLSSAGFWPYVMTPYAPKVVWVDHWHAECSSYDSMLQTRKNYKRETGLSSTATSLQWRQVTPTCQSLQRITKAYVLYSRTSGGDVQWMKHRRQEDKLDSESNYNRVYILLAEYYLLSYH